MSGEVDQSCAGRGTLHDPNLSKSAEADGNGEKPKRAEDCDAHLPMRAHGAHGGHGHFNSNATASSVSIHRRGGRRTSDGTVPAGVAPSIIGTKTWKQRGGSGITMRDRPVTMLSTDGAFDLSQRHQSLCVDSSKLVSELEMPLMVRMPRNASSKVSRLSVPNSAMISQRPLVVWRARTSG